MQKILTNIVIAATAITIASCGAKSDNTLAGKKAQLASLKDQVAKLEADIAKLDTSASKEEKAKLVSLAPIATSTFTHYIDLQGKVDAVNISYVTPRNGGGQVKALYIKQGDMVKKGQLLLKLDDVLIKKQIDQAKIQLNYAKDIYQRRQNLWDEKIGSEVDLISAKNNVDLAQKQLDLLNQQLELTSVYADVAGVAEDVTVRVGELFSGNNQIKIVNIDDLKVTTQVPENYIDKVKKGDHVKITFPDLNKTIDATITLAGKIIDMNGRSFYVEAHLPTDKDLKPNQVARVQIQDYNNNKAIAIPVNTLQTDDKGKYVLVATKENNKMVARKKPVTVGLPYADKIEVTSGLQPGDEIITDGYQSLYDGQAITTTIN
jgi:RND family efflux transporter MFP subunit